MLPIQNNSGRGYFFFSLVNINFNYNNAFLLKLKSNQSRNEYKESAINVLIRMEGFPF